MLDLKPMDIIIIHGQWYMPHHWLIQWRSLYSGVHCVVVRNSSGGLYNPTFLGIKIDDDYGNIDHYKGRKISVLRYKHGLEIPKLEDWCTDTIIESEGYDFLGQWLLGFVCGINTKKLADNPKAWTCAEFPYWLYQDTGHKLTSIDESLPMPRLFRFHNDFECVFEGKYT